MNIRHECPVPDLSYLVTAPLQLELADGRSLFAERWSLAGVHLDPAEGDLTGEIDLAIPFQGVSVKFPARIEATEETGRYKFVDLTVRQRETLAVFYKGVLSGQMVATGDIITSLDTPVDLVPMGETAAETSEGKAKEKPRLLRIIKNLVYYTCLALFLIGFVGGQIWSMLSTITLDHARFIAPITGYEAPQRGHVDSVRAKIGNEVEAGDVLFRLEDQDRESDVEEVRAEVYAAERRLKLAQAALDAHMRQFPEYRAPLWNTFERAVTSWRATNPSSASYPAPIIEAWEKLHRFDSGLDRRRDGFHERAERLELRVEDAVFEMRRWKRELRHRKSAADALVVRAKTAGVVHAVNAEKGAFVSRNDIIVEIEENTPRIAVGWLDDAMATSVHIGMQAEIAYTFRGQPKRILGEIVDLQAGTDSFAPDRYGMLVTIKAHNAGLKKTRKWFRPNAPARIDLQRNLIDRVLKGHLNAAGS